MNVYLEEFKAFPKVTFYSFCLENEEYSETDRFIDRFIASSEYRRDLSVIRAWIAEIGTKRGALPVGDELLFRSEDKAIALPPPTEYGNSLRLYGCVCSDDVVILGGGGRKTTKKAQIGDTADAFRIMNQVSEVVKHRLSDGSIWIANRQLQGSYAKLVLPG